MRAMRLRAAVWGVLFVAAVDLVALVTFYALGWLGPAGPDAGLAERLALPLAFIVLVLTLLGAASILLTTRPHSHDQWALYCFECGREPEPALAFCHHCGASA